eukprot:1755021-Rhodomonas_salina.1
MASSSQTSAATEEREHASVVLRWSSDFLAQFIKSSVMLLQDFDEDTREEAVQIVRTHRLSWCSLWDRQNACLANVSGQMLDLWRCIKILVDPVGGKMMAEMEEEAGVVKLYSQHNLHSQRNHSWSLAVAVTGTVEESGCTGTQSLS